MAKIALSISLVKENVTLLENILKDVETPSCPIEDVGTLYFKNDIGFVSREARYEARCCTSAAE